MVLNEAAGRGWSGAIKVVSGRWGGSEGQRPAIAAKGSGHGRFSGRLARPGQFSGRLGPAGRLGRAERLAAGTG
jgi:hypothetical protein